MPSPTLSICLVASVLTVAALARSAPDEPPAPASDATLVTIADFAYDGPATVAAGTVVTVANRDAVGHTLTAVDGSFDTGLLDAGASASLTFPAPGTFAYVCSLHPSMTGSITVTG